MSNSFDQFDEPAEKSGNAFDQFDPAPKKPAEAKDPGFIAAAARGFKRALPETKSLLYGAGAALAGAVGADGARDALLRRYKAVHEEDVAPLQSDSTFLGSVRGEEGQHLGEWAGDTIGNFGGQALQSAVAAGAGALAGSEVPGLGNAVGAVGGLVAKGAIKKAVERQVGKMVAEGATESAARAMAMRKLGGATLAGAGLNVGQEVGIGYTGRADEAAAAGEDLTPGDAARAIVAGVPAGLLDTAAEAIGLERVMKGGTGASMLRRVAGGAAAQAGIEGGTEAAQAVLERAGAGQELASKEALVDYVENAAAGALGGGVLGGAGGIGRNEDDAAAEAGVRPPTRVSGEGSPPPLPTQGADGEIAAAPAPVAPPAVPVVVPDSPLTTAVNIAAAQGTLSDLDAIAATKPAPDPMDPAVHWEAADAAARTAFLADAGWVNPQGQLSTMAQQFLAAPFDALPKPLQSRFAKTFTAAEAAPAPETLDGPQQPERAPVEPVRSSGQPAADGAVSAAAAPVTAPGAGAAPATPAAGPVAPTAAPSTADTAAAPQAALPAEAPEKPSRPPESAPARRSETPKEAAPAQPSADQQGQASVPSPRREGTPPPTPQATPAVPTAPAGVAAATPSSSSANAPAPQQDRPPSYAAAAAAIEAGDHGERALASFTADELRAVGKELGFKFSAKATPGAMIERISELPRAEHTTKILPALRKLARVTPENPKGHDLTASTLPGPLWSDPEGIYSQAAVLGAAKEGRSNTKDQHSAGWKWLLRNGLAAEGKGGAVALTPKGDAELQRLRAAIDVDRQERIARGEAERNDSAASAAAKPATTTADKEKGNGKGQGRKVRPEGKGRKGGAEVDAEVDAEGRDGAGGRAAGRGAERSGGSVQQEALTRRFISADSRPVSTTGRQLSYVPKIDLSSDRRVKATLRRIDDWLLTEARAEAKSRNDDHALTLFKNRDSDKLSDADRAELNLYLFGDEDGPAASEKWIDLPELESAVTAALARFDEDGDVEALADEVEAALQEGLFNDDTPQAVTDLQDAIDQFRSSYEAGDEWSEETADELIAAVRAYTGSLGAEAPIEDDETVAFIVPQSRADMEATIDSLTHPQALYAAAASGRLDYDEFVKDPKAALRLLGDVDLHYALEATAPRVANDAAYVGMDVDQLKKASAMMRDAIAAGKDEGVTKVFNAPTKDEIVRLQDKVKVHVAEHGWMTVDEAKKVIEGWKDRATEQGKNNAGWGENGDKIVLSLFDLTGSWSEPWVEAGYQVLRFDIQADEIAGDVLNFSARYFIEDMDLQGDVYAILAACPCTDFAGSGARHFKAKDKDGRTVDSVKLLEQTMRTIEFFKPPVWAIENPSGRIDDFAGMPPWRLSFNPNHLGDPYTKRTLLWGRFNADLPIAPVEPTEGSKMHRLYGGKSQKTKNARSATPEGFSYGFFMANNFIDNPVMAVSNKYDRLDRAAIEDALKAGITPQEIDGIVGDAFYIDLDDDKGNRLLREAAAERRAEDPLHAAAHEAATSPLNTKAPPTEAQIEAGNYAKGHISIGGEGVTIENPAGSKRRPEWPALQHAYGYFKRTEGADGEHVDGFFSKRAMDLSLPVVVVNQNHKDGTFDEHKVMVGFDDLASAIAGYKSNYSKGWKGLRSAIRMTWPQFREWLHAGKNMNPAELEPVMYVRGRGVGNAQAVLHPDGTWATRVKKSGQWQEWRKVETFDPSPTFGYRKFVPPSGTVRIGSYRLTVGQAQAEEAPPPKGPPSLLAVVASNGGINREWAQQQGVDPAEFKERQFGVGKWLFPKTGGMRGDALRSWMQGRGYLPAPAEGQETVDDNDALDLLMDALGGTDVHARYNAEEMAAVAAYRGEQVVEAQAEEVGGYLDDVTEASGVELEPGDEAEVAELAQLVNRLLASGMAPDDVDVELQWMEGRPHGEKAAALLDLIRSQENRNADRQAEDEGGARDRAAGTAGQAAPGFALEAQVARQEEAVGPAPAQAGLFAGPTRGEQVAAARREKDAERDGRTGTGRTDILAGDGALFAGPAPAQAELEAPKPETKPAPAETKPASRETTELTTLAGQLDLFDRLADGGATLADYRAGFAALQSGRDGIVAELSKLTKDQLVKLGGWGARPSDPKPRLISSAHHTLIQRYGLGEVTSFTIAGDVEKSYLRAIQRAVDDATEATLRGYAERIGAQRAQVAAKRAEVAAGLENPTTIEDFVRIARASGKGEEGLTDQQRFIFDRLRTEARAAARKAELERAATVRQVDTGDTGMALVETKHTQKGHDLFVVRLDQRVEREVYNQLNVAAKRLGGHYSSFKGNGAVPGFQFTSRDAAEQFMAIRNGDVSAADAQAARAERKAERRVETLAEKAATIRARAEEALGRDRKDNTARRARMAQSAEANARRELAIADTMDAIAASIDDGGAVMLNGVQHRTQVELLDLTAARAAEDYLRETKGLSWEKAKETPPAAEHIVGVKLPQFTLFRDDAIRIARTLRGIRGGKSLAEFLEKEVDYGDEYGEAVKANPYKYVVTKSGSDGKTDFAFFDKKRDAESALANTARRAKAEGGATQQFAVVKVPGSGKAPARYAVAMSPETAIERDLWRPNGDKRVGMNPEAAQKLVDLLGDDNVLPWTFKEYLARRAQFAKLGITTNFELREALREYLNLRVRDRGEDPVKKLERALAGRTVGTDFFPTPPALVQRLIDEADIGPGMRVLEPSAGKGDIAEALRDAAEGATVDTVETSSELRAILEAKGFEPVAHDFLEYNERGYDRIVMNPPFGNDNGASHVRHAFGLLKPGGRLVAIMGAGARGKEAFDKWLDSVGGYAEPLPEGSFKSSFRPTGVSTVLVVVDKPEGATFDRPDRGQAAGVGVDPAAARQLIGQLTAGWKAKPRIEVIADASGYPDYVKAEDGYRTSKGVYDPTTRTVYLNAARIRDNNELLRTLAHEMIGHHGVEAITGPALWKELDATIAKMQGKEKWADFFAEMERRYGDAGGDRSLFVKEVIAVMAEKGMVNTVTDRVLAAVRRFLRTLGFNLSFSDAELLEHIATAARYVQGGEAAMPGGDRRALRSEAAPIFYSALLEAAMKAPIKAGTAAEWKGYFDGAQRRGEIKQAERDWLELDDWLEAQEKRGGKSFEADLVADGRMLSPAERKRIAENPGMVRAKLTRDDVAAFIRANKVEGEEVLLGELDRGIIAAWWNDEGGAGEETPWDELSQDEQDEAVQRYGDEVAQWGEEGDAQYRTRTLLGGGEEYRELILTLPEREAARADTVPAQEYLDAGWTVDIDYNQYTGQSSYTIRDKDGDFVATRAGARGEFTPLQAIESWQQSMATGRNIEADSELNYRSGHWGGIVNPLVHVRFDTAIAEDGSKTLFIEEIQSDWHQKGRRHGYRPKTPMSAEERRALEDRFDSARRAVIRQVKKEGNLGFDAAAQAYSALVNHEDYKDRWETSPELDALVAKAIAARDEYNAKIPLDAAAPAAPFKGTDEWAMLAFKRVVRWAAENGHQRIAWTTGAMQAERYDLSKQVKQIDYAVDGRLMVKDVNNQLVINEIVPEDKLEDMIGKEAAEKLMKQPLVAASKESKEARWRILSGLDLKIGGEGMVGFYDKILPKAVEKWGKRFGAKVSRISLSTPHVVRPTYGLSSPASGPDEGKYFINPLPIRADDTGRLGPFASYEEAKKKLDELNPNEPHLVHAIEVTPAMREASLAGLPLFQRARVAENRAKYSKPRRTGADQLDLFAATPAIAQTFADRARLNNQVRNVQTGSFNTSVKRIASWTDAANIVAPIRKMAQEYLVAVVADRAGRPLAVLRHTVGKIDEAMVDFGGMVGAISAVDGAAQVYLAHNHPSGNLNQSAGDRAVTNKIMGLMAGSGIDVKGMIVVASGEKVATFYDGANNYGNAGTAEPIAKRGRRDRAVPAIERTYRKVVPGVHIDDPSAGAEYVNQLVAEGTPSGLVLLSTRHNVVGVLPMTAEEMSLLRTGDPKTGAAQLFKALGEANAAAVIIFGSGADALNNVGRAVAATERRVVDTMIPDENFAGRMRSTALRGESLNFAGTFKSAGDPTDTPEFKRWFKDSKVVRNGKPIVVHHGTADDFHVFDKKRGGASTNHLTAGLGFFFAENRKKAEAYADRAAEGVPMYANVIDAYLSLQKPYKVTFNDLLELDDRAAVDAFKAKLLRHGWDGLHVTDIGQWVAFEPNQIKDAYRNSGDFNPANPSILFSKADPTESAAFKAWFGKSKIVDAAGQPLVVYHGAPDVRFLKEDGIFKTVGERYGASQPDKRAFWFTKDYATASTYADDRRAFDYQNADAGTVAAYLKLENPLIVDGGGKPWREAQMRGKTSDVIEEARAGGHDGAIIRNVRDDYTGYGKGSAARVTDTYVVFSSNQIKSATGNNGNFDPANPSILFSRADTAGEITLSPAARMSVKDKIGAKLTDMKPALLAAIPLNYLGDYAAKNMTAVKQYIDQFRDLEAFRNQLHTRYDAIAQEWVKWATTAQGPLGLLGSKVNARGKALADLMHDSTIVGVDPATDGKQYAADPVRRAEYRELRERFEALGEVGQGLFVKARDSYDQQIKLLEQVLQDNFMRAMQIRLSQLERELDAELKEIDDEHGSDEVKTGLRIAARERHERKVANVHTSAAARVQALKAKMVAMRVDAPYFPLKRFGKYFVAARDTTGKLVSFSKFEGSAEAETFAKAMAAKGLNVAVGHDSEKEAIAGVIDPRFIADLDNILSEAGGGNEMIEQIRDAMYQRYLESLPDMSLRKSFIHRKLVPGYNPDALRSFSSVMFHGSYQIARLKYGMEMSETLDVAEDQAKRIAPVEGVKLVNELRRRHQWVMNPTGSVGAQVAASAAFVWHLAANPAHLFLNATQTAMLGIPILGSKYGFGAVLKALGRAGKDFAAGRGHIERTLEGDELKAMEAFLQSGLIDKSQSHDLAGVGETGVEYSANRQRVMAKLSWFFHQSERFNREVTAMAAYRLARKAGETHERAVRTASDLTWQVHFDYSAGNRPRIMQNDAAKILLVFRNYNINLLYRLFRDIHTAFRGETREARKEAMRQLGAMFGMYSLMAGVTGVPLYGAAMAIAGMFDDDDEPFDAEERFKQGTIELLGEDAAAYLLNGVPGTALGVDVSERIGMPNLWFRSPDRELEGRDAYYYWMEQLLGATPAIAKNVFTGLQQIHEGHVGRGVETMLPNLAKSPLRAARYVAEGGARTIEGDKLTDTDGGDVLAQLLGFTPATVASQYDENRALKNAEAKLDKRRKTLLNRYAMATMQGDPELARETLARIVDFNRTNPAFAITQDTIKRSLNRRAHNDALAQGGIVMSRRLAALQRHREEAEGRQP